MSLYFAVDDVNLRMDDSYSYKWVMEEGRQNMINNSMALNQAENTGYLENSTLVWKNDFLCECRRHLSNVETRNIIKAS